MSNNTLDKRVENDIVLNMDSVWTLPQSKPFLYSDGITSEHYLRKVFSKSQDLSSQSQELERWIKDWPSEYHLSAKRSQLLRGFNFDRSKKVLEVGCGCGAITRFLGETFDDVVSVEGSLARSRLARLRTRGLDNVSILSAPFQEIRFKGKFDLIICVGVFEYSGAFVDAEDPYDSILQYFNELLTSDGQLIIAIENQFGLKYFSSSSEDHTNRMFEGIEGYPNFGDSVRTFGYDDLKSKLMGYFPITEFYFPYPDYKLPVCILSEKFLDRVDASELIGQLEERDYSTHRHPLFDESLAYAELDKNGKLPFFSNSFLVISTKQSMSGIEMQGLGVLFTSNRSRRFQTVTHFLEHDDHSIWAHKEPVLQEFSSDYRKLSLRPTRDKWQTGHSLHSVISNRARNRKVDFEEIFLPCKVWVERLKELSTEENGTLVLDGKYLDCIWRNSYIDKDACLFIDLEWEWHERIPLNTLIIRAIYCFLSDILFCSIEIHPDFNHISTKKLFKKIVASIGIDIKESDYRMFRILESDYYSIVSGRTSHRFDFLIRLFMWSIPVYRFSLSIETRKQKMFIAVSRLVNYLYRQYHRLWTRVQEVLES